jgi:very-short-patch-repair endonuclease
MHRDWSKISKTTWSRARQLRHEMNSVEKKLWYALRANLSDVRVRKQHAIGPYIVDFCIPSASLIIEIDGDSHFTEDAREHDASRNMFLEREGWKVIRFLNREVNTNTEGVVLRILQLLGRV